MGDAVDNLRATIDDYLKKGNARIVVDLKEATALDSSGIGVLVRGLSLAKQKGGTLKLSAVPAASQQTLQITGVARLFEIFSDSAAAEASFGAV